MCCSVLSCCEFLVSSVPSQKTCWEKRLQNDLICVQWGIKRQFDHQFSSVATPVLRLEYPQHGTYMTFRRSRQSSPDVHHTCRTSDGIRPRHTGTHSPNTARCSPAHPSRRCSPGCHRNGPSREYNPNRHCMPPHRPRIPVGWEVLKTTHTPTLTHQSFSRQTWFNRLPLTQLPIIFIFTCSILQEKTVSLSGQVTQWTNEVRYLGVHIIKSRVFRCSLTMAKRSFYRGANYIFGKVGRTASEEVTLHLKFEILRRSPTSTVVYRSLQFSCFDKISSTRQNDTNMAWFWHSSWKQKDGKRSKKTIFEKHSSKYNRICPMPRQALAPNFQKIIYKFFLQILQKDRYPLPLTHPRDALPHAPTVL